MLIVFKGDDCPFSHDFVPQKRPELCKFYIMSFCERGATCIYYHGDWPCKFFHVFKSCSQGDACRFSHQPLTDETRPLLEKVNACVLFDVEPVWGTCVCFDVEPVWGICVCFDVEPVWELVCVLILNQFGKLVCVLMLDQFGELLLLSYAEGRDTARKEFWGN